MLPAVHRAFGRAALAGLLHLERWHDDPSAPAPQRLTLFIDAQNVYKGARDAFFDQTAQSTDGQVDPMAVAQLIAGRQTDGGHPCVVHRVRIYSGFHTPFRNPKAYGAFRKQQAKWKADGCEVVARPLRYPRNAYEPPQEKGIDVALAIDFVEQALDSAFDIGVMFTTDTDQVPALELVRRRYGTSIEIQVAAWHSSTSNARLRLSAGEFLWCHRLTKDDYDKVHDPTPYARS